MKIFETLAGKIHSAIKNPIPPNPPFRKCRVNIPVKWVLSDSNFKTLVTMIWFSCHSKTPYNPHLLQDGNSVRVMSKVENNPATNPIKIEKTSGWFNVCHTELQLFYLALYAFKIKTQYMLNLKQKCIKKVIRPWVDMAIPSNNMSTHCTTFPSLPFLFISEELCFHTFLP